MDVPKPKPPHLYREKTRHGKAVWYVREGKGKRFRLTSEYGTEEFWREYRDALKGKASKPSDAPQLGSIKWLINRYMQSAEWARLKPATRKQRELFLRQIVSAAGEKPVLKITRGTIQDAMDRRRETPFAANNFLKTVRALFGWALSRDIIRIDPSQSVKFMPRQTEGYHTWTPEELEAFETCWRVGTKQRLTFDLLLYTGLRRGDVVNLGRQHLKSGWIRIRAEKTGAEIEIPAHPNLLKSLSATTCGDLTFLTTDYGRPFTKEGFGGFFKKACLKAGVKGSAHGIRKAGAVRAAENGATEAELNSWFGWSDRGKESAAYIRRVNKAKLANNMAEKMGQSENINFPHHNPTLSRTLKK